MSRLLRSGACALSMPLNTVAASACTMMMLGRLVGTVDALSLWPASQTQLSALGFCALTILPVTQGMVVSTKDVKEANTGVLSPMDTFHAHGSSGPAAPSIDMAVSGKREENSFETVRRALQNAHVVAGKHEVLESHSRKILRPVCIAVHTYPPRR